MELSIEEFLTIAIFTGALAWCIINVWSKPDDPT